MVKKLCWLFVIYIVLLTVAPEMAAVVMGIFIASVITGIKLGGEGVRILIMQFSGQDVTNATAAILLTLGILLALYIWKPAAKRVKKLAK